MGEHGLEAAYYDNTLDGWTPTLECVCGAVFQGEGWREAGIEFDEHLDGEDGDE